MSVGFALAAIAGAGCAPAEPDGVAAAPPERTYRATAEAPPGTTAPTAAGSRDECRGEGMGEALFSASMASNAGVRLVLADVEAEVGPFSISSPATQRRFEGRRVRLRVRDRASNARAPFPSALEVNVHERSYHAGEFLGVARVASPEGHHVVAVGQRLLLTLVADVVDPDHPRVLTAVPVDPSTDALREAAYGVPAGGSAVEALRTTPQAPREPVTASRTGGAP